MPWPKVAHSRLGPRAVETISLALEHQVGGMPGMAVGCGERAPTCTGMERAAGHQSPVTVAAPDGNAGWATWRRPPRVRCDSPRPAAGLPIARRVRPVVPVHQRVEDQRE